MPQCVKASGDHVEWEGGSNRIFQVRTRGECSISFERTTAAGWSAKYGQLGWLPCSQPDAFQWSANTASCACQDLTPEVHQVQHSPQAPAKGVLIICMPRCLMEERW